MTSFPMIKQLTRIATISATELRPQRFFYTQNKNNDKPRLKGCCTAQDTESGVTSQDPFKYKLKTLRDFAQASVTILPRYDELYRKSEEQQKEISSHLKFEFKHHYDPMRLLILLNDQLEHNTS